MNRKATTLIEISLASLILLFAIIPLIVNQRNTATKALETEKIQMAERILESIKSELMTMQFKTFSERAQLEGLDPNAIGPFALTDAYYPTSISEVLKVQNQYKDFSVKGTWSWCTGENNKPDKTMVQAEISCSFSRPGASPIERKKTFLIVKP